MSPLRVNCTISRNLARAGDAQRVESGNEGLAAPTCFDVLFPWLALAHELEPVLAVLERVAFA